MKKNSKTTHSETEENTVRQAHASEPPKDRFTARTLENIDVKAILPRFLILLTPALLALSLGALLKNDLADFFCWWGILYLYGWAAFPLMAHFFRGFVSTGYGLSKSMGILITTCVVWLISYLGIWESFNRPMTWVMFFLLAIVCWGLPTLRNAAFVSLSDNSNIAHILWEEALFIAIMVAFCFCKGIFPTIDGEEKFMNFGFMNSMLRYDGLPAKDPWLAGQPINYYYYGQYLFSYITKMLGIRSEVAYTLSMCTAIALPFLSAYSLGQLFVDALRQKKDCQVSKYYLPFAGLLSACCAILFGNSHAFFYDEQSFGNKMLFWKIWNKLGINVGKTGDFFYPNSTRFIGHNPDLKDLGLAEHADYTIHEFPFYSYLVGDLHAHVVSMTIVLLIIAFIFVAVYRAKYPEKVRTSMYGFSDLKKSLVSEMSILFQPEFFVCAFLLGLTQMCNYWDFLIYFVFCAMGLLVYYARRSSYLLTFHSFLVFVFELLGILGVYLKFGENVFLHLVLQILVFMVAFVLTTCFPSAFSRTGATMAMLFSLACTISLSFNLEFDMISNQLALVDRHTSVFQFMILWLIHLLIPLALILLVVFTERHAYRRNQLPLTPAPLALTRPATSLKTVFRLLDYYFARFGDFLLCRFFRKRSIIDIFMVGMTFVGFMLLLAPEIMYVRDIYGDDNQRANTMFKFTFAGFIILSLVVAYTIFRFMAYVTRKGNLSNWGLTVSIVMIILVLFIPGHYTLRSLEQRTGEIKFSNYKGLDGTAFLPKCVPAKYTFYDSEKRVEGALIPYEEAIDWLNENVKGSFNICEAYGFSYTERCIISAYTGLPTVFGWHTHEMLWHYHGIVNEEGKYVSDPDNDVGKILIQPRQTDVSRVYTSTDVNEVFQILHRYDITYVICGPMELDEFGIIYYPCLNQLGKPVFTSSDGSLLIYKVQ
ncbi:MAG: hypothetical protein J5750_06490 [Clostridiales bacterium]|nr:hypothetical protein [Clostridiales bacterium]